MYKATSVFIPVNIPEEVVKSVAQKLSGSTGNGGMDSEALQGWLLTLEEHSRKVHVNVEYLLTGWPIKTHHGPPTGNLCLVD